MNTQDVGYAIGVLLLYVFIGLVIWDFAKKAGLYLSPSWTERNMLKNYSFQSVIVLIWPVIILMVIYFWIIGRDA
jgi:hypothetical protein